MAGQIGQLTTFDPDTEPSPGPRPLAESPMSPSFTPGAGQMDSGNAVQELRRDDNPWEQAQRAAEVQFAQATQAQLGGGPAPEAPLTAEQIETKFKKIVGDQGNQIGEQRKLIEALVARLQMQPQPTATGVRFGGDSAPARLIPNRDPNDYPTARETEEALFRGAESLYSMFKQELEAVKAEAALATSGVTSEERLLAELQFPGLAAVEPSTRAALIKELVRKRREDNTAATTTTAQAAGAVVRKQVFVEQPQAITSAPASGVQIDIDAFGRLQNAQKMEEALRRLGAGRVNDYQRRG